MSDKGKRRASDVESEPEDETSQAQRQLSSHSEESGDEGGEEVTMHTQSIEAKRAVSQKLRKAALDVDRELIL